MTDPDWDQALANLQAAFGDPVHKLVRAKCRRCGRWCLRSPFVLAVPCPMCRDRGEEYDLVSLLLMVEFRLSWAAYQVKLEKYGPPWHSPKEWIHSRERQRKWNQANGSGRPRGDDTEGGRGQ